MTLPFSGPIKLSQLKTEFGGPGNLRAYLKGGTYVKSSAPNANVPASGVVKLSSFYGAENPNYVLVTSGNQPGVSGYNGFANWGSLTPLTYQKSNIVYLECTNTYGGNSNGLFVQINTSPVLVTQNYFTSISFIDAQGTAITLPTSNAVEFGNDDRSPETRFIASWTWQTANTIFANNTTYNLVIT